MYLQAGDDRTKDCKGCANGEKPKMIRTRMGEITVAVFVTTICPGKRFKECKNPDEYPVDVCSWSFDPES